jgi:DNA (cytosine-5)-methyltransferase 1
MRAYYNEIDKNAAALLRELIRQGHIAEGDVDERDIRDIRPDELAGYTQYHFFAGIGVWSLALRLAGWPDDRPVWTGSCPCQPFSAAGRRAGTADERHLWPHWHHLISQCHPATVFGEQVASSDGLGWLDLVSADMEATGYAFGAADLCAAGVGAPHIRQRLWFVGLADASSQHLRRGLGQGNGASSAAEGEAWQRQRSGDDHRFGGTDGRLADAADAGLQIGRGGSGGEPGSVEQPERLRADGGADCGSGPTNGFWRDADWLFCRDGKWRPVEPSTFPLAHGASDCLANVLSVCGIAAKRIADYAERTKTDPDKVLRMVRECLYQTEDRQEQSTGMRGELHAPQVLFDFMLSQATTCDGTADSRSIKKAGKQTVAGAMRIMRVDSGFMHTPHRREPFEQRSDEPANTLHELSFILARDTQAFGQAVLAAHAALNRVGMLRGYGNAIVPQVAATWIKAVMQIQGENP